MKRQLTSRRLIKDGERATEALYLKNLLSNGFGAVSGFFSCSFNKLKVNSAKLDDPIVKTYVINSKANCKAIQADFALSSSILLHQSNNHGTFVVVIIICIVSNLLSFKLLQIET